LLAHDDNRLISRFEGNPPGTVRKAALGVGTNTARSHALLVPTDDNHTGVPSNWGIPEEAGQPIGTVPVDTELSHASRVGWNYPQQANIKAPYGARAGFPNVIRAIDCTHIAIKAPSHDELVYVNRKRFHSVIT